MREVRVRAECPERNLLLSGILRRIGGPFVLAASEDSLRVPCRYIREDIGGILVSLYLYTSIAGGGEIFFGIDPGSSFTGVVVILGDHIVFKGVARGVESIVEAVKIAAREMGRVTVFIGETPLARRIVDMLGADIECILVPEDVHGGSLEYAGQGRGDRHVQDALKIALRGLYIRLSRPSSTASSSR